MKCYLVMMLTSVLLLSSVQGAEITQNIELSGNGNTVRQIIEKGLKHHVEQTAVTGGSNNTVIQIVGNIAPKQIEAILRDDEGRKELARQLNMADGALRVFFEKTIDESVPIEEWPRRLAEIATNYEAFVEKIDRYEGNDPVIRRLKEQAKTAISELDWETAESLLGKAKKRDLEIADELKDKSNRRYVSVAESAEEQALAVLVGFQYEKAGDHYYEAYELVKEVSPETSARYLNEAALNFTRSGIYLKAQPLFEQALSIRRKFLGEEHLDVATSLKNLAFLYREQGEYAKAEPLYEKALAIRKKLLGDENLDVATSLSDLAFLYYENGEYARTIALALQAFDIRMNLVNRLRNLIYSPNSIALIDEDLLEHVTAAARVPILKERKNLLIPCNFEVSVSLDVGLLKPEFAKLEPVYEQSLAMLKKNLGESHPTVTTFMTGLAFIHYRQGENTKAEITYLKVIDIDSRIFGEDHPNVANSLSSLACLNLIKGNYLMAERQLVDALEIYRKRLLPSHPYIAMVESHLKYVRRYSQMSH